MSALALIVSFKQRFGRIACYAALLFLAFSTLPAGAQWTALGAPGQSTRAVANEPTVLAIAKSARMLAVGFDQSKSIAFFHPDTAVLLGSTSLP